MREGVLRAEKIVQGEQTDDHAALGFIDQKHRAVGRFDEAGLRLADSRVAQAGGHIVDHRRPPGGKRQGGFRAQDQPEAGAAFGRVGGNREPLEGRMRGEGGG